MFTQKLSVDTLYTGGDIVTMDPENPYIRSGAIAIKGNKIVAIGTIDEVKSRIESSKNTVDFTDLVVMAGLVDGHTHLFQNLGKTLGDGLSLLPWLAKFMMPLSANINSKDAINAVRLGALHGALSGTTSIIDNHYAPVDENTIIGAANAMEEVAFEVRLLEVFTAKWWKAVT